jgi:hypothetical protein
MTATPGGRPAAQHNTRCIHASAHSITLGPVPKQGMPPSRDRPCLRVGPSRAASQPHLLSSSSSQRRVPRPRHTPAASGAAARCAQPAAPTRGTPSQRPHAAIRPMQPMWVGSPMWVASRGRSMWVGGGCCRGRQRAVRPGQPRSLHRSQQPKRRVPLPSSRLAATSARPPARSRAAGRRHRGQATQRLCRELQGRRCRGGRGCRLKWRVSEAL